jgi:hypothetical protein
VLKSGYLNFVKEFSVFEMKRIKSAAGASRLRREAPQAAKPDVLGRSRGGHWLWYSRGNDFALCH